MSEQNLPSQQESLHHESYRTEEDIARGFTLDPQERVSFDASPNSMNAIRSWDIGKGVKIDATPVAELIIGGAEVRAVGIVLNTRNGERPEDREHVLLIHSPGEKEPFVAGLKAGNLLNLGRGEEGQRNLPDTVSRDHCAVGFDENGAFVLENHNPSNYTSVRKI